MTLNQVIKYSPNGLLITAYVSKWNGATKACYSRVTSLQIEFKHSNFLLSSCTLSLVVSAEEPTSLTTFSVTHSAPTISDTQKTNIVKRFYQFGNPIKFFLSEKENSNSVIFFPNQASNPKQECGVILEESMNRGSVVFGKNKLSSCWIKPNRDEFLKFCKNQQDYAIFSKSLRNYLEF